MERLGAWGGAGVDVAVLDGVEDARGDAAAEAAEDEEGLGYWEKAGSAKTTMKSIIIWPYLGNHADDEALLLYII